MPQYKQEISKDFPKEQQVGCLIRKDRRLPKPNKTESMSDLHERSRH